MSKVNAKVERIHVVPTPPPIITFTIEGLTPENMQMAAAVLGAALDNLRDTPLTTSPNRDHVRELFNLFSNNGGGNWTIGESYKTYKALRDGFRKYEQRGKYGE